MVRDLRWSHACAEHGVVDAAAAPAEYVAVVAILREKHTVHAVVCWHALNVERESFTSISNSYTRLVAPSYLE
jgi:hypothetical protein